MKGVRGWALCAALIVLAASWLSAADFEQYRDFRLGSSVADVVKTSGASSAGVRTSHQRPALLQELAWRPYTTSRVTPTDPDSVREIAFSFVNDRLFRMVVEYDSRRTEGLTRRDMIAALTAIYGPTSPLPAQARPRAVFEALDAATRLAHWRAGDTTVVLQQQEYTSGFALVITSVPLDQHARKATATAVTLDAREAPAREAARVKQQADAARGAAEKTRSTNKETFKP